MRGDESELLAQLCAAIKQSPGSVEELAERAKVSSQILYRWLNGVTPGPRITTLERVADALGYAIVLKRGGAVLVKTLPEAGISYQKARDVFYGREQPRVGDNAPLTAQWLRS